MRENKDKKGEEKPLEKSVYNIFSKKPTKQYSVNQILKRLKYRQSKQQVYQALESLSNKDKIIRISPKKYKYSTEMPPAVTGKVDMTMGGNAYIISEELKEDVFVRSGNTLTALDNDIVKVKLIKQKKSGRYEGKIIEVTERAQTEFIGTLHLSEKFAFLIPDKRNMPHDIFIPLEKENELSNGDKALARIVKWPEDKDKNPVGEIMQVLGKSGSHNVEMQSILLEHNFHLQFPDKVLAEAKNIPETIPDKEIKKRRDMRDITTFTIDPDDAKDFDDAISIKEIGNERWEIGVHIADVSHYIREDSELDKEAAERATSVYLVDRVLPMFPEKISNEICSLRPEEDKLCFSAVFEMDKNGIVHKEWFGRTVIHSNKRFTYNDAQERLDNKQGSFGKELNLLNEIAGKLREERYKKGAISFETVEVQFEIDLEGVPLDVHVKERKEAHMLIEDFMLLANRKVAAFVSGLGKGDKKVPFAYRNHATPDQEKVDDFARFAGRFGYTIDTTTPKSIAQSMNSLLENVKGRPEQNVLEYLAIRTMSKAYYSINNIGHYGLAFEHYAHFTSPIRRYPDVMAHRILQQCLDKDFKFNEKKLEERCDHSSMMERNAIDAERASVKYKQVEYMKDKIGDEFEGIISGITEWGIFVEIIENHCEGLVRTESIEDDKYIFDEVNYTLKGMNTNKQYRLGDLIDIRVIRADMEKKNLDFEIADSGNE